jgi:hypothetical protein
MFKQNFILILFFFSSGIAYCQFPSPTNFSFSYNYIMLGDGGYCGDTILIGPTYCSHFLWNTPDTSQTSATLLSYKLHFRPSYMPDSVFIYSSIDTVKTMELGVMGWVWVTAVYGNPEGESDSSNIEYNNTLPINVEKNTADKEFIFYNCTDKKLMISGNQEMHGIKIYNTTGIMLISLEKFNNELSLAELEPGIYFVEIRLRDQSALKKIIVY